MAQVRNPASVPGVGIAADPGVRASPEAFGASIGAALQDLGDEFGRIAATANKLKTEREGLNDATLLNEADINLDNSYYDLQTELDDAAAEDSFDQFTDRSQGLADNALRAAEEKHGATLSTRGREKWTIRAAQMRNQYARKQSINAHTRQINDAELTARQQFDDIRSFVFQNPGAEEDARSKAALLRENLIESGIGEYYIDRWIGTEDQVAEKLKKVRIMAETDPNNPNFNPTDAMDQMVPTSELGTISNVGNWLGQAESGGRAKTNELGYTGIHQVGAPRLAELGLYIPGEKENLQTWSKTPYKRAAGKRPDGSTIWEVIPNTGKWTGTIKIPGFGSMTLEQFNENPAAQMQVWKIHERDIRAYVRANGLDQYIGQTIHGVKITMSGMIAGAHIGGKAGMKKFITSGADPADVNGTTISTYMKRAANVGDGEVNAVFAGMSPEDQAILLNRGNAAYQQQLAADTQVVMSQRADLDSTWESSVRSAQSTGQTVDWDEISAASVYGWEKVNEQKRKEARALQRYAAAAPLETMSKREQERYVLDLESMARAATGTTGHADAEDSAKYARRVMGDLQRMRDTAPAEAALRDPKVADAYREFLADPTNPTKAQPYITRSIRVQQGFELDQPSTKEGVDELLKATRGNIQHLPDRFLKEIAADFEDLPIAKNREEKIALQEELRQKYNALKGIYGDYTDEIILEAYGYMERNDGTDEVVIRAVRNIVKTNGAAPRATTEQEKKEEVGVLRRMINAITGSNPGFTGNPEGDAFVSSEAPIDEPSGDPIAVPVSREQMMDIAKEYNRRSRDDEWLDEQGLTDTQLKFIRSR